MRRVPILLTAFCLLLAFPLLADERHQSYFTYEDGGTVVRQGEDGRETEARANFPVFPGDEVLTSRRGRAEIRLADGNIVALDRSTSLFFRSILDSYEGEGSETVAELRSGQVIVHRLIDDSTALRLDTQNASYISSRDAIYGVDTDGAGRDVVSVYEGSIEVRTPDRTTRLRDGEQATLDVDGVFDVITLARDGISDFERWYLRRAERYGRTDSRYLNSRLSYADSLLDEHGSWVYAGDYGSYVWRPYVGVGWRPYYDGRWVHSPYGGLVWVSYEPWGWVPYHYGRWAYSGRYGWVWVPGYGYSHAWVYWAFGPSYVGWAPAGWWDCYTPYYRWAYRPHWYYEFGYGFYGRIRLAGADLSPWTFVGPHGLTSKRVTEAVLTTDAIRDRLRRDGSEATVTSGIRFTRNEIRDPASAVRTIARRGIGSGTGREGSGNSADLTPFFRRDPELSSAVRERIGRSRGTDSPATPVTAGRLGRGGGTASPGTGAAERGGVVARPRGDGGTTRGVVREPAKPDSGQTPSTGRIIGRERGTTPTRGETRTTPPGTVRRERPAAPAPRESGETGRSNDWRGTVNDRPASPAPERREIAPRQRDESWRGSVSRSRMSDDRGSESIASSRSRSEGTSTRRSVPRTVIDGIGGVRVTPKRDSSSSRSGLRSGQTRSREASGTSVRSGESRSGRSSGSSAGSGESRTTTRSRGAETRSSGKSSGSKSSGDSSSGRSSSSNRSSGGGKIQRH